MNAASGPVSPDVVRGQPARPEHFRAYSFVDRITALEAGKSAEGLYRVPADLAAFSPCLAAEAAAQLAAWTVMAAMDFRLRPIAGVTADLRFGVPVRPGQTLQLRAHVHRCDAQAVDMSAAAYVDGEAVVEIGHGIGPLLPSEELDDPDALRQRFELICGPGAPEGGFTGVPEHDLEVLEQVPGQSVRALLRVPPAAAFFADHFPRRPVFPGTQLLDAQIRTLRQAVAGAPYWPQGGELAGALVPQMKLRAFIAPGQQIELRSELSPVPEGGILTARNSVYADGRRIAMGSLRVEAQDSP